MLYEVITIERRQKEPFFFCYLSSCTLGLLCNFISLIRTVIFWVATSHAWCMIWNMINWIRYSCIFCFWIVIIINYTIFIRVITSYSIHYTKLYDVSATATEENGGDEELQTAVLVDGVVEGAEYETTSGVKGITDENGNFNFRAGDDVTFSVGGVTLGVATSEDISYNFV